MGLCICKYLLENIDLLSRKQRVERSMCYTETFLVLLSTFLLSLTFIYCRCDCLRARLQQGVLIRRSHSEHACKKGEAGLMRRKGIEGKGADGWGRAQSDKE